MLFYWKQGSKQKQISCFDKKVLVVLLLKTDQTSHILRFGLNSQDIFSTELKVSLNEIKYGIRSVILVAFKFSERYITINNWPNC